METHPDDRNFRENLTFWHPLVLRGTSPDALANRRLQPLGHPSTEEWVHGVCTIRSSVWVGASQLDGQELRWHAGAFAEISILEDGELIWCALLT